MANEGDRIEVQFTETEALAQKLLDQLERDLAKAVVVQDELEVARLTAKKQAIQGGHYQTRAGPEISQDTAALERENVVRQRGLAIELQTLEVLRKQVAERLAMAGETIGARGTVAAPPGTRLGGSYSALAGQQIAAEEQAARQAALQEEQRVTQEMQRQAALREASLRRVGQVGQTAGAAGMIVPQPERSQLIGGPQGASAGKIGGQYTAEEQALSRYNLALGEYQGFATRAGGSTAALTADMTRLGVVQAREANAMRAHGALTTEWLGALARGETTVSEFGYQMGATVGKFAGWTAAATATFAVLGLVTEFGKGAVDSANGVQQLSRTIDGLNTKRAAQQFRDLSQEADVSVKDAADAVFRFSRTFHDQDAAVEAARQGLSVYQLDQVSLNDSVKTSTALHVQYGLSMKQLGTVYDMLAAGQREYNARISDMVPLLQKSSGAVKNAGGDLNQLIQLGTVGLRLMPGLGGSQLGTAFYRGAATQAQQHAGDLASSFGLGKDINPLTGKMNFTQLLMDAIRESATLGEAQRRQLAADIFGKQYGGRTAAFFGPQAAALLDQVTGQKAGPQGPVTPGATRGALQKELDTQLAQTRKELDQFIFGIQRLGSALAASGALAPLGLALKGAIAGLDAITSLIEVFDRLPSSVKEAVAGLVELRLAMLFFSRTRIGSSAPGVTRIPGFRPSEATLARADLSTGTRAALQQVESNIARTTAQSLTTGAQALELEQRRAQLITAAGGKERLTAASLERSNQMSARIVQLKAQQTELEAEQAAQEGARAALNAQMVGLSATTRRLRMSDADVLALRDRTRPPPAGGGHTPGGVILPAGLEAEMAQAEASSGPAGGVFARSKAAVEGAGHGLKGLKDRVGGFVRALDPMMVGLFAFPVVFGLLDNALKQADAAYKQASDAMNAPVNNTQSLLDQAKALSQAANKERPSSNPVIGNLQQTSRFLGKTFGIGPLDRLGGAGADQTGFAANELHALGTLYGAMSDKFNKDGPALIKTAEGRQKLYAESMKLRHAFERAVMGDDLSPEKQLQVYRAFVAQLQKNYQAMLADPSKAGPGGKGAFATYASTLATPLETRLQGLDDRGKLFGTQDGALKQASIAYAALLDRARNWTDSTELQKVASAQQNFINAVNKNVRDLLHQATLETTPRGQMSDLNQALGVLGQQGQNITSAFQQAIDYARKMHQGPDAIAKLQEGEKQMLMNLADLHKQVVDQILQLAKTSADLVTSQVQGISPEADLQRAQVALQGLQQQLSTARSHGGDAQQLMALQTQINNAQNALLKQQVDSAHAVAQAQGQLAIASITSITPQADIQRAQAAVTAAQQNLGFVQSHGLGEAALLQAQAQVYDAQRSLNQAIQSNNQRIAQDAKAMIDAQAALAETQTVDPVKQAQEALQADIAALAVIKPQDYRTYQEYQTALIQQKAKVGQDQRNLRQQVVDQDMATLQFELHTQRISDQQYIAGLQQLLKMKKLTLKERQDIQSAIFDALHQSAVDLNVGSIKMPTAYEVRSAIARAGGMRGAGSVESTTHTYISDSHNVSHVAVSIYVTKDGQIKAVTDAVVKAVNQVNGQAQTVGMI